MDISVSSSFLHVYPSFLEHCWQFTLTKLENLLVQLLGCEIFCIGRLCDWRDGKEYPSGLMRDFRWVPSILCASDTVILKHSTVSLNHLQSWILLMENIKQTWYKVMVTADGNSSIVSQRESSKFYCLQWEIFISKETFIVWGSYIFHLQVSANPCFPNSVVNPCLPNSAFQMKLSFYC